MTDKDRLVYIIDSLQSLMHDGLYEEIDNRLLVTSLNFTGLTVPAIIAYGRVPFIVRSKLCNWKNYIEKAVDYLNVMGYNGPKIFRGIYDRLEEL